MSNTGVLYATIITAQLGNFTNLYRVHTLYVTTDPILMGPIIPFFAALNTTWLGLLWCKYIKQNLRGQVLCVLLETTVAPWATKNIEL